MLSIENLAELRAQALRYGFKKAVTTGNAARVRVFVRSEIANRSRPIQFEGPPIPRNNNEFSGEFAFTLTSARPNVILSEVTLPSLDEDIRLLFEGMLLRVRTILNLGPDTRMQMVIITPGGAISTGMIRNLSATDMFNSLLAYLISATTLHLNGTRVSIKYAIPQSGGAYFKEYTDAKNFVKRKRCCVSISGDNNNCFFECLVLGLIQWEDPRKYSNYTSKSGRKQLAKEAVRLRKECNIPAKKTISIHGMKRFSDEYGIGIIVVTYIGMDVAKVTGRENEKFMCVLYSENDNVGHFDYVHKDKIGALWGYRKFCYICEKGYNDQRHGCIEKCKSCRSNTCEDGLGKDLYSANWLCEGCNLLFFSEKCMGNHTKVCKKERKCVNCNLIYKVNKKEPHECYKRKCKNCEMMVHTRFDHKCFHQTLTEFKETSERYVFYDYECYFDGTEHKVAMVVAMYANDDTTHVFHTEDEFIEWMLTHKEYTFIAHNGGRYDFHFVKRQFVHRGIKTSDVTGGNTIFYAYCKNFKLRFVDSYRLIPIGLRKFSKTFGLQKSKGYFPYRFYTKDNLSYIGPIPPLEYFEFDHLKEDDRCEALAWYNAWEGDYDIGKICQQYCDDDVRLLQGGCMEFRKWFLDISNGELDPLQYITIASVCMALYRRFFLPQNQVGVLNVDNIHTKHRERAIWLAVQMNEVGREFEKEADGYDAFDEETGTYYDFINCLDHGCRKCFSPFRNHPVNFKRMHELNYVWRTEQPDKYVFIWGCEYDKWVRKYHAFANSFVYTGAPLNIRDAFFGGRTEPIKLLYKTKEGEKIRYYDYTSLYPSVQSGVLRGITPGTQGEARELFFPIGHPISITSDFKDISQYFGFVKCTVEPPKDLYLPVLPVKRNGKLIFDNITRTGTWTTIEVEKAVELGYRILKIFEVAHFPRRSSDLFRGYVDKFMKIKQEAKGWVQLGCETAEEKKEYIRVYELEQGITLDANAIGDWNPGKYAIAKLCLNNLWGKFGQRDSFSATVDTFKRGDFDTIIHNDENEILSVVMHNTCARTVTYRQRKEFLSLPGYTNIAIAAFTTAHARLRLYEALEQISNDVLYMDTDSVIFVDRNQLVTGPLLGDLTDELDEGTWITEFVSTGPKSYAYALNTGHTECKVKGITLDHETAKMINFEGLKDMVLDPTISFITKPLNFVIGEKHDIHTKEWQEGEGKRVRRTMDKRAIVPFRVTDNIVNTKPFS